MRSLVLSTAPRAQACRGARGRALLRAPTSSRQRAAWRALVPRSSPHGATVGHSRRPLPRAPARGGPRSWRASANSAGTTAQSSAPSVSRARDRVVFARQPWRARSASPRLRTHGARRRTLARSWSCLRASRLALQRPRRSGPQRTCFPGAASWWWRAHPAVWTSWVRRTALVCCALGGAAPSPLTHCAGADAPRCLLGAAPQAASPTTAALWCCRCRSRRRATPPLSLAPATGC